jgi:branched-chain amino acid transport system substrate-binding protein
VDVPDTAVPHSTFVVAARLEPVGGIIEDLLLPLHSSRTFLIGGFGFLVTVVLGALVKRRTVAFPLLVIQFLALGWALWTGQRLLLDAGAEAALPFQQLDRVAQLFNAAWWLVTASYLVLLLNRFAWPVLEERTQRVVPKMIKILCALTILLFSLFGVIAFVYGHPITNLLATSGLVGLIFGLAAQSNLSNIFSGIVLSIERPFAINDVIEVEGQDLARVTDMTWRTTRMVTPADIEVSVPNSVVADRFLMNYSRSEAVKTVVDVHLPPALPIAWVTEKIREGIGKCDRILRDPSYGVEYAGVTIHENQWVMTY